MKIIMNPSQYTFTPSLNQIDFASYPGFAARNLLAVIDVSTKKLIFSTAGGVSGFGGSFSGTVLTYDSSNAGQSPSDVLQVIYDDPSVSQPVSGSVSVSGNINIFDSSGDPLGSTQDPVSGNYKLWTDSFLNGADGTPVLTTYDPQSGEDGLNINLLNSSFGGQIGSAIPIPNNNSALSVGFLNSATSTLVTPRMDPVTNELIVQSSPAPLQDVNITQVGSTAIGTKLPTDLSTVGGSTVNLGQQTMGNSIPVVLSSNQTPLDVNLAPTPNTSDVLGASIVGQRNNQLEISFNSAPGATLITNTFTGAGSVSITNGHSIYQTGSVGAAASAQAVSVQTTTYRPAHELYACFTAAFTNMVLTRSDAKIGLFNSQDGFFIGFDIAQGFGLGSRVSGVDTIVNQLSFNVDKLLGSSGSKFTRDGVPEAINFAFSNLFRIRFAWLGSANIYFEVFSPDGEWVLFHNIKQPNSAFNPSINNPNLPMQLVVSKTAGTQNSQVASACWSAGTSSDSMPLDQVLTDKSLAKLTRTVIEGKTTGGGGGFVPVKVNPSGALTVEATLSGTSAMNLSQYGGAATTLGQKASSASMPVVISSDQSSLNTLQPDVFVTGASTNLLNNNLILAVVGSGSYDASGYKSGSVQVVTAATTGNFTFEGSNDNTNFQVIPVFRNDSASPNPIVTAITATASQFIYHFPIKFRYIRLRISSALNNSCQVFSKFSQESWSPIIPVSIQSTAGNLNATVTVSGSVTCVQPTPGSLNMTAAVTGASLQSGSTTDITSAAITTTQTSGNITQANIQACSFAVFVTAISGAGAAMDVQVQETMDGTNYFTIYQFERITTTGQFYSPTIKLSGSGVRYIRTVSGTTPSITNSLNRISRQGQAETIRRFINRTIDPNTLNSNTGAFFCDGVEDFNLIVRCTAQTTAATIALEFSMDGTNWLTSTATVTTVVGVVQAKIDNMQFKFVRANVTAAGTGITLGEVTIGGHSA